MAKINEKNVVKAAMSYSNTDGLKENVAMANELLKGFLDTLANDYLMSEVVALVEKHIA